MRRRTDRSLETLRCDCPPGADCSPKAVSYQTSVLVEADALHLGATIRVGEGAVWLVVDDETLPSTGTEVQVAFPLPDRRQPVRLRGRVVGSDDEGRDRGEVLTVEFDEREVGPLESVTQFLPCECCA